MRCKSSFVVKLTISLSSNRFDRYRVTLDLVKQQGFKSLFRGLDVTLVRAFPVNAVIFPIFECCIYLCQTPRDQWRYEDVFVEAD